MNPLFSRRTILAAGAVAAVDLLTSQPVWAAEPKRRVVVWSEKTAPKNVYPHDINGAVAEGLAPLKAKGWEIVTASITDPEQGCSAESLDKTNVLIWWGHKQHGKITDEHVQRIVDRVKKGGMGFIALHSAHYCQGPEGPPGHELRLERRLRRGRQQAGTDRQGQAASDRRGHQRFQHPAHRALYRALRDSRTAVERLRRRVYPARRQQGIGAAGHHFRGRQGPRLLFPARPRDLSDLLRRQHPQAPLQRRGVGRGERVTEIGKFTSDRSLNSRESAALDAPAGRMGRQQCTARARPFAG